MARGRIIFKTNIFLKFGNLSLALNPVSTQIRILTLIHSNFHFHIQIVQISNILYAFKKHYRFFKKKNK